MLLFGFSAGPSDLHLLGLLGAVGIFALFGLVAYFAAGRGESGKRAFQGIAFGFVVYIIVFTYLGVKSIDAKFNSVQQEIQSVQQEVKNQNIELDNLHGLIEKSQKSTLE